jgi:tetratricopeptide (TPR) repeat protein
LNRVAAAAAVFVAIVGCRPAGERRHTESLSYGPLPVVSDLITRDQRTEEAERMMLAGSNAREEGHATQASRYLRAGLALDPNGEFLWLQLCILQYDINDPAEAEESCTKAINAAEDPRSPNYDSVLNRGLARVRLGKLDAAEADFRWNKRMQPDNAEAYYDESWVWAARGDLDKVLENVRRAGELDPYYRNIDVVGNDRPYDKFRGDKRWEALLATLDPGPPPGEKMSTILLQEGVSGVPTAR